MKTWHYLWQLIRFRPGLYLLNFLCWTTIHAMPLLPGLVLREFFNTLTGNAALNFGLWTLIALYATPLVLRTITMFAGFYVDYTFTASLSALLRRNILEAILQRPGARALTSSSGDAISRFRDDVEEISGFVDWTATLLGRVILALVVVGILLSINVVITLLIFVPLLGVVAASNIAKTYVETYRRASRESTGRVTSFLGSMFVAVYAIKATNAEAHVTRRLQMLNESRQQLSVKDRVFTEVLDSIGGNAISLGTGIILLFAGQIIQSGSFTIGDFSLFVYYLSWMTEVVFFLGRSLSRYRQGSVSIERMHMLMQDRPLEQLVEHRPIYLDGRLPELPMAQKTAQDRLSRLTVSGLTYRYPESGRGIEDVDLEIEAGSFTVITGEIGSGKTTLVRALLGLLPPDNGTIRWNDTPVDDPAEFFVPPRVAYTPQVPRLFSQTLSDNILMGLPEDQVDLPGALRAAVMERDVAMLEHGLATPVGPSGVKLSGGQMQRVAAARMFVRDANLLVFDDLSSALDVETEQALWERLFAQQDKTCLVVSHRRAALRRATQIILLQDGRVLAKGSLDQLLAECEQMQRLWHGDITPSPAY
jgi:ATP-binding cassette subfamily B protein